MIYAKLQTVATLSTPTLLLMLLSTGCTQQTGAQNLPETMPPKTIKPVVTPMPELRPVPAPVITATVPVKTPVKPKIPKWTHSHKGIPGCSKQSRHIHPYRSKQHQHSYGCVARPGKVPAPKKPPPTVTVPKVKAKGTYKGSVEINRDVLKAYQKQRL